MALSLILAFESVQAAPQCDTKVTGAEHMVDRINRRYDDFFRNQRDQEERDRNREKGRGELRKSVEAREKTIEKARLAYIKTRREKPNHDAEIEAEMLRNQKQRTAAIESARRCYVQSQEKAEQLLKRGRMIPGNKEFDIED